MNGKTNNSEKEISDKTLFINILGIHRELSDWENKVKKENTININNVIVDPEVKTKDIQIFL